MTGLAKTDRFQFSTATICVGPQADQLKLNAADHSIGLVKNVIIDANPTSIELTQGLQNDVVFSANNSMQLKCSAEVYEFTAKNLAYGLSLDATGVNSFKAAPAAVPLTAPVAAAATSVTVDTDVTTDFPAGSWGFLQEGTDDQVHLFKVISAVFSSSSTVITFTGYPVPTGMSFTTAAGRIGKVNKIDADPNASNASVAVRIIGTLISDKRPIMLHFPKVKILKGFSMRFTSDGFGNLPFEFTPYTPVATDPGYSLDFKQRMSILVP